MRQGWPSVDRPCPDCNAPGVEYSLKTGEPVCDECGLGHVLKAVDGRRQA